MKDPSEAGEICLETIFDIQDVERLRTIWDSWQTQPNADLDFYLAVLRSRPEILTPYVLLIRRDGVPDGMLIGRVEKTQLQYCIGYKQLYRAPVRQLTFLYGGRLGNLSAENCQVLLRKIVDSMRQGEADVAFFNCLNADSQFYANLRGLSLRLSRDYFPVIQCHRRMTLPSTPEEFWLRLSPKSRKNQRWQAKKLLGDYPDKVKIRCFREPAELDQMLQDVEAVAKETYQRGLGVGFTYTEETRRHFELKAEKRWLRSFVLYVDSQPCAFWCGSLYSNVFHSDFMGYDPEYSKYSPGMYLITSVIEQFCKKGGMDEMTAIDFGLGDAQYKQVLGDMLWQEVSVYLFAPTFKGWRHNLFRTPIVFVDRLGRRMVERTRLLQTIKKAWRNRVSSGLRQGDKASPVRAAISPATPKAPDCVTSS